MNGAIFFGAAQTSLEVPGAAQPMMFLHTPYASGKPPFVIGLSPLDPTRWIEPDEQLADQLAMKEAILAREGAAAFDALPGAEEAQAEVLELLAAHLVVRYPKIYRCEGNALHVLPGERLVAFGGEPALLTASRLVQEDLLLMRRDSEGWRLVAGSLCFPSTWVLAEKLGRDMDAIHRPVPDYAGKMAGMVARIFDNLKVEQPVERHNWSIYSDARLRYAQSKQDPLERFPPDEPVAERAHVRVERQTLRRLPCSGHILFTIRVHVDPVSAFAGDARGRALARALHDQLAALSPEQLAYKGIEETRARLLAALLDLAEASNG
jgi:dimethylamine monooxygenase subunit A